MAHSRRSCRGRNWPRLRPTIDPRSSVRRTILRNLLHIVRPSSGQLHPRIHRFHACQLSTKSCRRGVFCFHTSVHRKNLVVAQKRRHEFGIFAELIRVESSRRQTEHFRLIAQCCHDPRVTVTLIDRRIG